MTSTSEQKENHQNNTQFGTEYALSPCGLGREKPLSGHQEGRSPGGRGFKLNVENEDSEQTTKALNGGGLRGCGTGRKGPNSAALRGTEDHTS